MGPLCGPKAKKSLLVSGAAVRILAWRPQTVRMRESPKYESQKTRAPRGDSRSAAERKRKLQSGEGGGEGRDGD